MQRFDEDCLLDHMAERGALTLAHMDALGATLAAFLNSFLSPAHGNAYPHTQREGDAVHIQQSAKHGEIFI